MTPHTHASAALSFLCSSGMRSLAWKRRNSQTVEVPGSSGSCCAYLQSHVACLIKEGRSLRHAGRTPWQVDTQCCDKQGELGSKLAEQKCKCNNAMGNHATAGTVAVISSSCMISYNTLCIGITHNVQLPQAETEKLTHEAGKEMNSSHLLAIMPGRNDGTNLAGNSLELYMYSCSMLNNATQT